MIVKCRVNEFHEILAVINDGASAYKGVIPPDRWHEPYMTESELETQIKQGVEFWCCHNEGVLTGVMGIQEKGDVTLIRHAYVRSDHRNNGIGSKLLLYLKEMSDKPVLIGTWTDATWAIAFYQKHGFRILPVNETEKLLRKYWMIPERQIQTSVVLANDNWISC